MVSLYGSIEIEIRFYLPVPGWGKPLGTIDWVWCVCENSPEAELNPPILVAAKATAAAATTAAVFVTVSFILKPVTKIIVVNVRANKK